MYSWCWCTWGSIGIRVLAGYVSSKFCKFESAHHFPWSDLAQPPPFYTRMHLEELPFHQLTCTSLYFTFKSFSPFPHFLFPVSHFPIPGFTSTHKIHIGQQGACWAQVAKLYGGQGVSYIADTGLYQVYAREAVKNKELSIASWLSHGTCRLKAILK